jgi:hypothetical protein
MTTDISDTNSRALKNYISKNKKGTHGPFFIGDAQSDQASLPWQALYFLPLPHGQGSLRPTFRP